MSLVSVFSLEFRSAETRGQDSESNFLSPLCPSTGVVASNVADRSPSSGCHMVLLSFGDHKLILAGSSRRRSASFSGGR